jgi:hypothetical protein
MAVKLILEVNDRRQVFSLDDLAKSFLKAIQTAIRQEVDRALSSGTSPISQQAKTPR